MAKPKRSPQEMFEIFRANTEMNLRDQFHGRRHFHPRSSARRADPAQKGDRAALGLALSHRRLRAAAGRLGISCGSTWSSTTRRLFSMPDFAQQLPIPQFRVAPSIDPLSDKNKPLDRQPRRQRSGKIRYRPGPAGADADLALRPVQGPAGSDRGVPHGQESGTRCQLVLAGGGAPDDPEGEEVLREVQEAAADDPDIHVLLLPPFSDLEINALVRGSTVVMQKSVREGFGLTVSEALWKRKPVIGGAVGGIKLQVIDGVTGFLVHSPKAPPTGSPQLLGDRKLRERWAKTGTSTSNRTFWSRAT